MKALVLTDNWKYNLSKGDYVTEADYSSDVLHRADGSGYVIVLDGLDDDMPMKQTLKDAGYHSEAEISEATDEELLEINGIGEARLLDIRNFIAKTGGYVA